MPIKCQNNSNLPMNEWTHIYLKIGQEKQSQQKQENITSIL